MERKLVSFVIPCYNEVEVISETVRRLSEVTGQVRCYDFEFVFVDDGSVDGTLALLREAAGRDPRIRVICFARNFGHQIAVSAGIAEAEGDAVILIDADLQDPPEVTLEMLQKWEEGYDVVYGVRRSREGESAFKLGTARAFYRILNSFSDIPIPLDTGDFRLMSRPVVEVLKAMPEKHRFVRGMVAWAGFRQYALPYDRTRRMAGISKYPLGKMLKFATDGILSFSSRPLQVATGAGLLISLLSVLGIVYALYQRIFTSVWVEGWTALMIAVLFLGGVQLICLGVIGEYLGRVYVESKDRPLYVVRERIGGARTAKIQHAHPLPEDVSP